MGNQQFLGKYLHLSSNPSKQFFLEFMFSSMLLSQKQLGRFHQTLCAKQKFASAQQPAKKTPFNFINNIYANYVSRNLPNLCAVCQTPFATKSIEFCKQKHLAKIIRQKFDEKVRQKSRAHILMKSTPVVNFTIIL